MKPVRWLVQLPPPGDDSPTHGQLERACQVLSLPFASIEVTAGMQPRLPPLEGPTCVHGRMTLLRAALGDPAYRRTVFFEPARFTVEASLELRALSDQLSARKAVLPSDLVAVSPTREIDAEARLFIVEGKVIGGSFYRPDASARLSPDLIDFAQEAASVWAPEPVFVLDVARIDRAYRIVETNCMNGCRFYGADVVAVVSAVSNYQPARPPGQAGGS